MTTAPPSDDPVFERTLRMRPSARAAGGPGLAVGIVGACALGALVFFSLSRSREQANAPAPPPVAAPTQQPAAPDPAPVAEPLPVVVAPASAPSPPAPMYVTPVATPAAVDTRAARLHAPAVVVELGGGAAIVPTAATVAATPGVPAAAPAAGDADRFTADERFAQRVGASEVETARASRLRDPAHTAPQGTVVPAVLETALNSDLPGALRAVVARDVRGFDGRAVLIPRGSKLIGQYRSAVAQGQTRAFVVWSRLLTPDGVSIDIGSPAADRLGRGGLAGETDSHFLRRFGAAILLSVMSAGAEIAAANQGGSTALIINSPQQATRVAEIALQKQIDIPPTIKVAPGTPLQVFVTRDLDFSGLGAAGR